MGVIVLLLACGLESTKPVVDTNDDGEARPTDDTDTVTIQGCVFGNARDDYNIGEANVPVRAFLPDTCDLAGESVGDVGGDFCLDDLPVGVVEVQVTFDEGRCAWWHGYPTQITQEGDCTAPETCVDLGILAQCYGETPICEL